MRLKVAISISIVLLIALAVFWQQITSGAKVILFLTEQLPQIPIKPLGLLSSQSKHEFVSFGDGIVADLFLPKSSGKKPAIIITMGVKMSDEDKPNLYKVCDSLARLGYIVLWPRLEDLEKGIVKLEDPTTFVESFRYLESRSEIDKDRISFVGISAGASVALVAAQDPIINQDVHSLIFFAGYYNIMDYLSSIATKTMEIDGEKVFWNPHPNAVKHAERNVGKLGLKLEQFAGNELTKTAESALLRFSPDQNLTDYKAPIFIIHDRGDTYVPYTESVRLKQALEAQRPGKGKSSITFHLANLFEHVLPKKDFSPKIIGEFLGLFGFLHKVFMYI